MKNTWDIMKIMLIFTCILDIVVCLFTLVCLILRFTGNVISLNTAGLVCKITIGLNLTVAFLLTLYLIFRRK